MDMTYDPVYASLKDTLKSEGSIRVILITEVPMPNVENLDFIDSEKLKKSLLGGIQWAMREGQNNLSFVQGSPSINKTLNL